MAVGDPRVPWQVEACPSWCVVEHRADDHPHDRKHVGRQRAVTARVLRERGREPRDGDHDGDAVTEVVGCLHRRDGGGRTWVYLGDGFEQRLEIALDDVPELVALLGRLEAEAAG